jgi:hypothetical protein
LEVGRQAVFTEAEEDHTAKAKAGGS